MYYTRNHSPPGDISADKTNSIKPEFSTFIEELEETTEKLMNEVFNLPSISEIRPLQISTIKPAPKSKIIPTAPKQAAKKVKPAPYQPPPKPKVKTTDGVEFLRRSRQLQSQKELRISMLSKSLEEEMKGVYTYRPVINKTTVNITPISQRSINFSKEKEKIQANKRILQNKRVTEELLKECTHKPKINPTVVKKRTVQQYCKDQMRWEKARWDSAEKKKQLKQIQDNKECTFEPEILTKKSSFYNKNTHRNKGTKVEDRQMALLEKSAEKKRTSKYVHI